MTLTRLVFKSHKWLAAVTGIFTFLWFASAVAMVLPRNLPWGSERTASEGAPPSESSRPRESKFKAITISVPQAIVALESATAGKAVAKEIGIGSLEGKLSYRIDTERSGVWWVNTADGLVSQIDAEVAKRLVIASEHVADKSLGPAQLIMAYDSDYNFGSLPAFRFEAKELGRVFTVEQGTGIVQRSSRLGRLYRFVTGMHTFSFLRPHFEEGTVRFLMWILAIVGTAMSVFGLCILWLQLRQWQQMRRND